VFILSGCVVRTYQLTKDRVDQDLASGNRGYIAGQTPEIAEQGERKPTRTTQVIEVELHSPIKFVKGQDKVITQKPQLEEIEQDQEIWGNQGYLTKAGESEISLEESGPKVTTYTVQKNDTLQKISQKFFGTTKKWMKIYEANKDVLKGPSKIYAGQVIKIPEITQGAQLKEPAENLK
jgi:nucleoid-associated protein YgaU